MSGTKDAAYYYSSYHITDDSSVNTDKPKIMILGGGPGTGSARDCCDYCCVHAAIALKEPGFERFYRQL